MSCTICNIKINRSADKLICVGKCRGTFHPHCVKIKEAQLVDMRLNGQIDKWTCVNCSTANSKKYSIDDIYIILQDLKSENINLVSSIQEIHNKFDQQAEVLNQLISKISTLEDENNKLREENCDLKLQMDDQEQYTRRNCLEIHGLPEVNGENITAEVIKIGRAIGINISSDMIDNCHRLGRKGKNGNTSAIRGVIVKFLRNFDKEHFLKNRKVKRALSSSELGFDVSHTVYVNENLTQYRRSLMASVRKIRRDYKLSYVWTKNGNIFVRERENSQIINIKSEKDIKIIEERCKDFARQILNHSSHVD